jgi:hypothetical protein
VKRVALAVAVVVLILCAELFAKGPTVRITVTGGSLGSPLVATPKMAQFSVWTGPTVRVNGQPEVDNPYSYFDWSKGRIADRPHGLQRYQVIFDVKLDRERPYVVWYEYDPATPGGYIYLPGKGEKHYRGNTSIIYHGVEGSWFSSSQSWEQKVRPLIEKAKRNASVATGH